MILVKPEIRQAMLQIQTKTTHLTCIFTVYVSLTNVGYCEQSAPLQWGGPRRPHGVDCRICDALKTNITRPAQCSYSGSLS